jgi:hypothetical protein
MKNIFQRVWEVRCVVIVAFMILSMTAVSSNGQPGPAVGVTPDFPAVATVGTNNIPMAVIITNTGGVPLEIAFPPPVPATDEIRVDLFCTSLVIPCAAPDANTVFTVNTPGTGRAGSSCAGISFNIVPQGTPGSYLLQPAALFTIPVAQSCIIDFTVNANALPATDVNGGVPGLQTNQLVSVSAHAQGVPALIVSATGSDPVTVDRLTTVPTMTEWGMIIFMILAGLSSIFYLRKYRRA